MSEAEITRLRALPVWRTIKMITQSRTGEWVNQGMLYTIITAQPHTIDEDDPSIYGEQLLGHEGRRAWLARVEIRGAPTT